MNTDDLKRILETLIDVVDDEDRNSSSLVPGAELDSNILRSRAINAAARRATMNRRYIYTQLRIFKGLKTKSSTRINANHIEIFDFRHLLFTSSEKSQDRIIRSHTVVKTAIIVGEKRPLPRKAARSVNNANTLAIFIENGFKVRTQKRSRSNVKTKHFLTS